MEKRLSYIVVGSFVIVLAVSLLLFMLWLTKYGNQAVEHDYYKTYFKESVSGLNVESLVKLRGVEVGRVKEIAINKDNSEEVEVLLEIMKDIPIKEDTFTTLDSQGITGLKYIELKGGSHLSAQVMTTPEDMRIIPSKKSVMSQLFDSSGSITVKIENILDKVNYILDVKTMDNIAQILDKTNKMMSDKNIDNISKSLEDFSQTMAFFNANKYRVEKLLLEVNSLVAQTKEFEKEVLPSITKLGVMSDKAGAASDRTSEFFIDMRTELKNGEFNVATIVEKNLQVFNETAASLQDLSLKLETTVDNFNESPSDILFKSKERVLGPGEDHD